MEKELLRYVPSPTPIRYQKAYTATVNPAGRMQYHEIIPGETKTRISRADFILAFNNSRILSMRPRQVRDNSSAFQLEFYVWF